MYESGAGESYGESIGMAAATAQLNLVAEQTKLQLWAGASMQVLTRH